MTCRLVDNIEDSEEITHFPFSSLLTQEQMCILFMEIAWIGVSNWILKPKMKF